ncbi:SseB family protein [Roseovarius atlanticus]|uniref:SseB family protein n=1 Tax=Roseovarius atlanticus TaxID=1641875 RepID=UPI001C93E3C7|nr:SseB family protein [Roseovarius atlanticus]MBY5986497.1 SseB family protein [Roseovarius atlanticus]MBY6125137.1 SseB family protein [Roseovarius atlanticus]MBY6150402.1 SseB family protein [Roseovarius atlanticus]
MTEATHLDRAHAAMEAGDEAARLRYYQTLAAAELFLLLEAEAQEDDVVPQAFEVEGQTFVLAFDTEERLSGFAGDAAHYVALSGRAVAEMLAEAGLGLGLNLEAGPQAALLPNAAMVWLAETLAEGPEEVEAQPQSFHPPKGLPEELVTALDARLAAAGGLAELAYLVGVTYENGTTGHLLGVVDAVPGADTAIARAVSDVLALSGLEAALLDVGFFRSTDPAAARMALVGLRFDLPKPEETVRPAPGTDPGKPPKLK